MKSLACVLLLLTMFGCGKKEGPAETIAASDSITSLDNSVPSETVPAETVSANAEDNEIEESFDGPEHNYDQYLDEPQTIDSIEYFSIRITLQRFTEDPQEEMICAGLEELLKEYGSRNLEPVKRSYNRKYSANYEDEGGQPYTEEIIEKKSETWWYDSAGQLAVYTSVYREDAGSSYHDNTQIFLFDADSIVGGFEDASEATQIAFATRTRVLTRKCPYCGVQINNDLGSSSYQLEPLRKAGVTYLESQLDKSRDQANQELLQGIATAKLNSKGIYKYTVTTKDEHPYKAKLEIGKSIYDKLFAGI